MPGLWNFLNHFFTPAYFFPTEDDFYTAIVERNQKGSIHSATGIAPAASCCRADSFICFSSIRADDTEACFL